MAILGATRGMGRALARQAAEKGHHVFLLGRDKEQLSRSAADISARVSTAACAGYAHCDLSDTESFERALDEADAALGDFDTLVITAAEFATQDELESDPERAHALLTTNFSNTVYLCELARRRLMKRGGGTLCVFSSVAGERGRKPVVLYGASKAGLSAYLEGLDHRYRSQGLTTVCVKPGFVRTAMTAALKPPPFAGEPDHVADTVLRAIEHGTPEVYAPAPWRPIMSVIRHLPRFVMRRAQF